MLNRPTILACTDFSFHSDATLRTADNLRESTHGKLYVAHVSETLYQLDVNPQSIAPIIDQRLVSDIIHRNMKDKMREQILSLTIKAEPVFALGVAADEILNIIQEKNIDILVMGNCGASALESLFLGGLTQKMLRLSPVPVLVVKKEMELNKVIGLVDGSDTAEKVIDATEELAYLLNSDLEFVSLWQNNPMTFASYSGEFATFYINSTDEEKENALKRIKDRIFDSVCDKMNTSIRVEATQENKVAHALVDILNEDHAQLAVMGSHHKSFLDRVFLGSETKRVMELFEGNVIVLPSTGL